MAEPLLEATFLFLVNFASIKVHIPVKEERASKKLKDKETELHLMSYKNVELEKLTSMTMELQRWKSYALQLEARFSALHGAWQDYNTTRGIRLEDCSEPVREGEGESPQVEPDRVKPSSLNLEPDRVKPSSLNWY